MEKTLSLIFLILFKFNLHGEEAVLPRHPSPSPDGSQIAFTSARDGNYEIYVMRADGTNLRRATHHNESDDFPTWQPDGRKILTVAQRNGQYDLYLIDVP